MQYMDEQKSMYVTRVGRNSKQKFTDYKFAGTKIKTEKMPILHDNEVKANRRREREAEMENLNRQRHELEELRRTLEAERTALQQQQVPNNGQAAPVPRQQAATAEELTTIMSNVQNFHIDIKLPKFRDEMEMNPVGFLEEMKRFFKAKNIRNERKNLMMEHALEGKAALWRELQDNIIDYEDFKRRFLDEFHLVPIRVQFKNAWTECRYNAHKESLQTYYYRQVKDARYFIPKLTQYEVNYTIIQQYPVWVKEAVATVNFNDDSLIGQTLASLDGIRRQREKENDNRSYGNNNSRQLPHGIRQMNVREYEDRDRGYRMRDRFNTRPERNYPYSRYDDRYSKHRRYEHNVAVPFQLPDTRVPPPTLQQNPPRYIDNNNANFQQNTNRYPLN